MSIQDKLAAIDNLCSCSCADPYCKQRKAEAYVRLCAEVMDGLIASCDAADIDLDDDMGGPLTDARALLARLKKEGLA